MYEDNLVRFYANKVLNGNQHVVIKILGGAGQGKSMLAGSLIIGLANYMGEKLNRDPRTLFNFKKNFACINLDKVQGVMEDPEEYNILWLDDIGVALNSRKFYKVGNMDFNDILQTFRPNKNILIVTTQYDSLIDAVIRKIAGYHIEMTHKLFDMYDNVPLTGLKVSEVKVQHKTGDVWYPFLQDKNYRYVQYVNQRAPDVFVTEYDRLRALEFRRMLDMKKEAKEEQKIKDAPPLTVKDRAIELHRDLVAGVYGDMTFKALCKAHQLNYNTAKNYV
jgi:hypothetical protein